MYIKSVNQTVESYSATLHDVSKPNFQLENTDFDTGRPSKAGEYSLADKTYAHLLDDLAKDNFSHLTPDLKRSILQFYGDGTSQVAIKKNKKETKHGKNCKMNCKSSKPLPRTSILPLSLPQTNH